MALLLSSPDVSHLTVDCRRFEAPARSVTTLSAKAVRKFVIFKSGYGNDGVRVSVRVRATVKDLEEERIVNDLDTSSLSEQRKAEEEEKEKRNNYYVNTGYAIRTIREEFPALFYNELNFDIYRDDIVFKDPLNTFVGIDYYKSIFWALRFHGRLLFRTLLIDIISVWQPVESTIMVRWTVLGVPRVPWESRGRFDATSEYKLDKNGKIYEHQVHNIALNAPPKFHAMQELIQVIGCPSTPKPTYSEISSSFIKDMLPIKKVTEIRHRLSSIVTGARCLEEESSGRS